MCRYGLSGPYKEHYACFTCRKAFKRRLLEDVDPDGSDRPARCPQCGGPMANMGLDFAPPPMRDRRAWGVLSELWMVGETFHGCGCGGPGYRPRSPAAFRDHLQRIEVEYQGRIAAWTSERDPDEAPPGWDVDKWATLRAERHEAVVYWRGRLEAIRAAMAAHGVAALTRPHVLH